MRLKCISKKDHLPEIPGCKLERELTGDSCKRLTITLPDGSPLIIEGRDFYGLSFYVQEAVETADRFALRGTCGGLPVDELFDTRSEAETRKGELEDSQLSSKLEISQVAVPVELPA